MKTLSEVNEQISSILSENYSDETAKKRARKELEFLRVCKKYLETQPSEEFIQRELDSVYDRVQYLDDAYDDYVKNNPAYINEENPSARYRKEMDYQSLLIQIKTLKFLLS